MTGPGATLELWEALSAAPPVARGAVLMVERGAVETLEAAFRTPLADGAAVALCELREREGPHVETVISCPSCGSLLDLPLDLDALPVGAAEREAAVGEFTVRAPTTEDVLAAAASPDVPATLRARCVEGASGAVGGGLLPPEVLDVAEELCGIAALVARVVCVECAAEVAADVDLVELLWERLAAEASAVLGEVGEIAVAFGWSESEILAMSTLRRSHYLALARGNGGRR